MEKFWDSASSGNFKAPGRGSKIISFHREGVEDLFPNGLESLTPWSDIKEINVYRDYSEWVLKAACDCGAGGGTFYNAECSKCDGFGILKGSCLSIPHDTNDEQSVDWFINLEGMTMFWSRQSGALTRLRDKTLVFLLDVPRVNFHCMSKRDKADPSDMNLSDEYGGLRPIRKRSFAYHDELRQELVKIQLEKEAKNGRSETFA